LVPSRTDPPDAPAEISPQASPDRGSATASPVAERLPALAQELHAKQPIRVPRLIGRLFAGEAGAAIMTELRGASNPKAKRELQWSPAHPSWREGFQAA